MDIKLNVTELNEFVQEVFPQVCDQVITEEVTSEGAIVRWKVNDSNLRPGGTVSGPTMFAIADVAMYLAIISRVGLKALAVTTNCSIDFMRKPEANTDLIAVCTLLKVGRVLAVGDVLVYSEGLDKPVARAGVTYSLPPK